MESEFANNMALFLLLPLGYLIWCTVHPQEARESLKAIGAVLIITAIVVLIGATIGNMIG